MAPIVLLVLFATWLFAAGGAVGSFLNVVVYRVPLGLSIVHPGSHCPKCQHAIRPRDNIPVLGWLLLGGRCRDCREPISPRYPIVEFVAAAMFLAVGWCEWLAPQGTAPVRPAARATIGDTNTAARATVGDANAAARAEMPFDEAGLLAAFHLVLLATLLPAALVEFDGQTPPWKMAMPAAIVGALAPLAWPSLRPVPAWGGLDGPLAGALAGALAAGVDGLVGMVVGGALGAAAWLGLGPRRRRTALIAPALVGLYLGAQMVAVVTPAVASVHAAIRLPSPKTPDDAPRGIARLSPGLLWWAVALAWILVWNALVQAWPWLGRPLGPL